MNPHDIAAQLSAHPSIRGKLDIAASTKTLGLTASTSGRPGDDAAAIARPEGGWDLLAGEGFMPQFVQDDPWFAGWCGVMVNLSDIAAMGGRATALLDAMWAPDAATAAALLEGLRAAAEAYGVPLVGGHTNLRSTELNLAVSVMGRASCLISSFAAQPGDALIAAIDHRGEYRPRFDNWCAALEAPHHRLRGDYELLPLLAEGGLVDAGKDISQGGLVGTSLMLAECSRCGFDIDLTAIPLPPGVEMVRWLRTFPSYGFLLSVRPENASEVCVAFEERDISAAVIGKAHDKPEIALVVEEDHAIFWNYAASPYLSLTKEEHMPEVHFTIRWPDGAEERCYSPSTAIHRHLAAGETYPLAEFLDRARAGLNEASDRVAAKYGFACSSAMDQLALIEQAAKKQPSDGHVTCLTLS